MHTTPRAYFITFTCYGTWLHGDERGSRSQNPARHEPPNAALERSDQKQMGGSLVSLDREARRCVHEAIEEVCAHRGWHALAINVRTNHVHVVVQAEGQDPDRVMGTFKAWATRRLREKGLCGEKVWTRGGSTVYLWSDEQVGEKYMYVMEEQDRRERFGR